MTKIKTLEAQGFVPAFKGTQGGMLKERIAEEAAKSLAAEHGGAAAPPQFRSPKPAHAIPLTRRVLSLLGVRSGVSRRGSGGAREQGNERDGEPLGRRSEAPRRRLRVDDD